MCYDEMRLNSASQEKTFSLSSFFRLDLVWRAQHFLPCVAYFLTFILSFDANRSLIYGQNNMQTWGLIVLLVSKMAGHSKDISESEQDAGVLKSQKTLAEVVEMVRTANMIHSSGVLNLQHLQKSGNDLSFDSDLIFGNKIALLGGDILLGNASTQMAQLK